MRSEHREAIDSAKPSNDGQSVFAPIAANCWNLNDIRSLNKTTEVGVKESFGGLEIIDQVSNVDGKETTLLAQASVPTLNQQSEYEQIKASGDRQAMHDDYFSDQAEFYDKLAQATTQSTTIDRQSGYVSNKADLDAIDPSQLSQDAQFAGPTGSARGSATNKAVSLRLHEGLSRI